MIVDRGQFHAPWSVDAEVNPARFAALEDLPPRHWKLAGFQSADPAKMLFDVSTKLIKRDGLRRKANHAANFSEDEELKR
jgi:hypothetical protein